MNERRQKIRLIGIIEVEMDDRRFAASNVSASGFCVIGEDATWSEGMQRDVQITFMTPTGETNIACQAELMRREPGLAGFRYVDLDPAQKPVLNELLIAQQELASA